MCRQVDAPQIGGDEPRIHPWFCAQYFLSIIALVNPKRVDKRLAPNPENAPVYAYTAKVPTNFEALPLQR